MGLVPEEALYLCERGGLEVRVRGWGGEGGGGGGGGEDGRGWVSGDVAVGNEGSEGVMRGVGGKRVWTVRWVAVDLERL